MGCESDLRLGFFISWAVIESFVIGAVTGPRLAAQPPVIEKPADELLADALMHLEEHSSVYAYRMFGSMSEMMQTNSPSPRLVETVHLGLWHEEESFAYHLVGQLDVLSPDSMIQWSEAIRFGERHFTRSSLGIGADDVSDRSMRGSGILSGDDGKENYGHQSRVDPSGLIFAHPSYFARDLSRISNRTEEMLRIYDLTESKILQVEANIFGLFQSDGGSTVRITFGKNSGYMPIAYSNTISKADCPEFVLGASEIEWEFVFDQEAWRPKRIKDQVTLPSRRGKVDREHVFEIEWAPRESIDSLDLREEAWQNVPPDQWRKLVVSIFESQSLRPRRVDPN